MMPSRCDPHQHQHDYYQNQQHRRIKKLGLIIETIDLTEEEEAGDEKRVTQISREGGGGWENVAPDPRKARRSPSLSTKLPKWRNRAAVSGLSIGSGTQKLPPTLLSPSSTRTRRDMTKPPPTTTAIPGMGMRAASGSHVPRQSSVSTTAWSTSGPNRGGGEKRRRASLSVAGSISTGIKRGSASLRDNVHYWVSSAVGGGDHRYQKIS